MTTARSKRLVWLLATGISLPLWAEQVCDTGVYPLSAPTERFKDNGDGTVTDRQSNLMWMRCAAGQSWSGETCTGSPDLHSWQSARQVAEAVNASGSHFFKDWRLPKLPELASIIERQCSDPRVNLEVFPGTPAGIFWTATARPNTDEKDKIYGLSFGIGGVTHIPKGEQHMLRLVRTGP